MPLDQRRRHVAFGLCGLKVSALRRGKRKQPVKRKRASPVREAPKVYRLVYKTGNSPDREQLERKLLDLIATLP